jgi:outer membrane protein TolC
MFNRITLMLVLLATFGYTLPAQQVDFDMVVQPVDQKARDFSEYLVQLAWLNSPESQIAQEQVKNAFDASKNIHKEWMRDIQSTVNLNEANIRSTSSNSNIFFPRYNVGLSLNLFSLFTQGRKDKISNREIKIAEDKVNQRKLDLRNSTLNKYAKLKLARQILKIRTLAEQDVHANYVLIQQLYKTDEKTFEEYTQASGVYFAAQEARLKAETDVLLAKYDLEALIGIKWEQVVHPAKEE